MSSSDGDGTDALAEVGRWDRRTERFDHLPVHAALLHTGKVLAFAGSGNDPSRLSDPYPAELWDPAAGTVDPVDQALPGDVFCVGHAFLPDGRLLAAGGTHRYDRQVFDVPVRPFEGLDHTYLFDPETERWTRADDMRHGRWYPTCVTLGDGRVLTAAGLTKSFPWVFLRAIEVFDPDSGWSRLRGAGRWLPLYPRFHLLPNGDVFYAGSYNTHYTFPFTLKGFPTGILDLSRRRWLALGPPNQSQREEGASVLLPLRPEDDYAPRVMLAGGGRPGGATATAATEIIDLRAVTPTWRTVDAMHHARYYTYAVLLPDGGVFVMGGRAGGRGHDHGGGSDYGAYDPETGAVPSDPRAVHEAEVFDPETETWTPLAPMTVDRLYHSNAVLLPDGRVATMGSNPARRVDELRIEVFSPPYLFRGDRPGVDRVPDRVGHGEACTVTTPDAGTVDEAVLIRQSATTHCLNTDQRLVELPIEERAGDALVVEVPEQRNLLPPGYYMLFLLRDGVPSEAPFLRVGRGRRTVD